MRLFRYDPTKHGTARWLGPLAAPVMDWLWERNDIVTVRTVVKHYTPRLQYNTAATTLDRLTDYGLLRVTRQRYGYHLREFAPAMSRLDWEQYQVNAIIESLSIAEQAAAGDGWGYGGW